MEHTFYTRDGISFSLNHKYEDENIIRNIKRFIDELMFPDPAIPEEKVWKPKNEYKMGKCDS